MARPDELNEGRSDSTRNRATHETPDPTSSSPANPLAAVQTTVSQPSAPVSGAHRTPSITNQLRVGEEQKSPTLLAIGSLHGVPESQNVTSPLLGLPDMDVDRARIDAAMHESVQTPDSYLNQIASHLIVAGGKRLRPVLAVAAARIHGDDASDDAVRGGVACELVHLGSLYHDDVMDEADTRRGVETVNARWGNLQAIVAGDFLLARASEIAASLGIEVAGLLARTIGWLCEGQIEELRHTYDIARPESSYFASIHGKTASLYGTAARVGGIVAGHDRPTIEALTEFGNAYGMVFQIVDDILDVTATDEQLGKPAGHDMVEGVYTLPVLRTLAAGNAAAAELAALLGSPLDVAQQQQALTIVRSNDGVASAMATAREYVQRAEDACAGFAATPATDALRSASHVLLESAAVHA